MICKIPTRTEEGLVHWGVFGSDTEGWAKTCEELHVRLDTVCTRVQGVLTRREYQYEFYNYSLCENERVTCIQCLSMYAEQKDYF
jgi:hypothetical protein